MNDDMEQVNHAGNKEPLEGWAPYDPAVGEGQAVGERPEADGKKPGVNGMAVASLVMGILSLPLSCTCLGGMVTGVMAIAFALASRAGGKGNGVATAGLVTGIIGLVLALMAAGGLFFYIMSAELHATSGPLGPDYEEYLPGLNNLLVFFVSVPCQAYLSV